ncbi:uracil-DNA glycosylase [Parvularcula marina]|nr:uracil-DNA glycosylase [Parvularcula marina]
MTTQMNEAQARALLDWYKASGIDTAEASTPTDFTEWPKTPFRLDRPKAAAPARPIPEKEAPKPVPIADTPSTDEAVGLAQEAADGANSIEGLAAAIAAFEGCPLKAGARNTVVYDGIIKAPLLIIGEAPGREEDRIGKPFVGRAGQLLDRMLASIGHSRSSGDELGDTCITNSVYWRPPGNRAPTEAEKATCLPFLRKFIELSAPKVIVLTGNVSTQSLFPGAPGITRSRGTWREWPLAQGGTVPVMPIFHPAYLLRSPAQKRLAWADLLQIRDRLCAT